MKQGNEFKVLRENEKQYRLILVDEDNSKVFQ